MLPWVLAVSRPGVSCVAYLDDRVVWTSHPAARAELLRALACSETYDNAFGLVCRPAKCGVRAVEKPALAAFGLDALPYDFSSKLPVLGVVFNFERLEDVSLLNWDVDLALSRVTAVARATASWGHRMRLLRALVVPMFTWAAGIAYVPHSTLTSLRHAMLASCCDRLPQDVPWGLFFEHLGWAVEPFFAHAAASLRAAVRFHTCHKALLDEMPISLVCSPWYQCLPGTVAAMRELSWFSSPDGSTLHRRDQHGSLRAFVLGVDSFSVVQGWLTEVSRRRSLASCSRVHQPRVRQDPDGTLAKGLVLPKPPEGVPCYQGHRRCFAAAGGQRNLLLASLATGCSWWHFNRQHTRSPPDDPVRRCACTGLTPSRPHLVWNCSATSVAREGVRRPANRSEERLFACILPERPKAPVSDPLDLGPLVAHLADTFVSKPARVLLGSDGSVCEEVAAFAVATSTGQQFACGLNSEDQSAYRAEVEGALFAVRALAAAAEHSDCREVEVILVLDCKSALQAFQGLGEAFFLVQQCVAALHRLRELGLSCELVWVPSHFKVRRGWCPPSGFTEAEIRSVSAAADHAARILLRIGSLKGPCFSNGAAVPRRLPAGRSLP